ncbi:membrane protein [Nocardioides fonticola]|uniref:Membrane protein n=2 Tax=Nocardioides fonticola TaxID=450363 RepID=A0ABP7X8Y7_9ACTN
MAPDGDLDLEELGYAATHKLPQVTLLYWVIKIAATTLGETGGDMFSQTLKFGYFLSTVALFAIFLVSLVAQLRAKSYHPAFYWAVILTTSMAGTTISDFMNRDASAKYLSNGATSLGWGPQGLGIGYPVGAAILSSLLIITFAVWRATGHPFSITKITSFKAEALFWTAILISNTLGTSLGDFLSDSSGLGYAGGAALIAVLIAIIAALYFVEGVPNTVLFWAAFVLTRPLGATVGDYFTKPTIKGGLGLGTYGASAVLAIIMIGGVAWVTLQTRRETKLAVAAAA